LLLVFGNTVIPDFSLLEIHISCIKLLSEVNVI
jgi:hypothetical protein